jgi:hypothetical protein
MKATMSRINTDPFGDAQGRAYRLAGFCVAARALAEEINQKYGMMVRRPAEDYEGIAERTAALLHTLKYLETEAEELAGDLLEIEVAGRMKVGA